MIRTFARRSNAGASERALPARHVVATTHGNRTVLMDVRGGHYFTLDEVGSRIWAGAAAGRSIPEITQTLIDEYDVDVETATADVASFVAQMRKLKLLVDA